MVLPLSRPELTAGFTSTIPGWPSRSLAGRAAAEAFVYLMHRCRVREHELAVEGWIGAADRPVTGGTSREIVRRYRLAPPFWALTVKAGETTLTGYGVNTHAVLVRYAQRTIPLSGPADGFTAVRTEFGPGCRELLRRASGPVPAFVCESLTPREAQEVAKAYLIDAAMSLTEGRGPLVIGRPRLSPRL
jgi:hypothetical protein